ncbi:MAG: 50S ribosomal protein L10 [Limnothrix sp.]|uniref:50S ribosomal protein L10 n=1 Tax=unclassified Limnothrix TaxID=2632864 RepID=UPI00081D3438|nr:MULTISPECIES: 50S ribosomal protein L10 [unclassified Limnothrix]MEB3117032.1 50S ribosomal protein L10 [Limnothrix sp.]OCQ89520.1 50S ribosomal protein L10 [Limnothrix sp. P13C2]MBD2162552.1 50S ribosomal protein L10 [Limnothrix sp. FACHB-1083]MBD2193608.1 50S ribosomal protein L10 [Limnothrix sp. FACHB-1088]MBD2554683.1 50S ribosomal protein L10 [Limnothrix sp. FACHB-708]
MGRTLEDKQAIVADLKSLLTETEMVAVIDYAGLSVAELSDLRNRIAASGAVCKVTKNTLMRIAVEGDANWQPMTEFLKGTSAFLLLKGDLGAALKAYQDFQKASKKTELRGGVMEGRALTQAEVKAIADLPSKEQLIAQIAGGINGLATKIAFGVKEVPSMLARGIKAISEKQAA